MSETENAVPETTSDDENDTLSKEQTFLRLCLGYCTLEHNDDTVPRMRAMLKEGMGELIDGKRVVTVGDEGAAFDVTLSVYPDKDNASDEYMIACHSADLSEEAALLVETMTFFKEPSSAMITKMKLYKHA
jgi:hypothetical protein